MENKDILKGYFNYNFVNHPKIKGMQIVNGKNNFPISWLNKQAYCEYQLYLENSQGIKVGATSSMIKGTEGHNKLESEFKKTASPATFDDAIEISKEKEILSREVFVISPEFGIRGYIDEIQMTPDEFIIIDDKPGTRPYPSSINQVRAYCLAFKSIFPKDNRKIKGALRTRGEDTIFWSEEFDEDAEKNIKFVINRVHGLFNGEKPFIATKNPNKCRSCRFQSYCDKCQL